MYVYKSVRIYTISSFSCSHKSPNVSQPCSHNIIYTTRRQYRHCANRNRFFLVLYTYIFFDIYFPIHITCVLCVQILYNIYILIVWSRWSGKIAKLFFFSSFFIFSFHFFIIFRLQRKQKRRWWTSSIIHRQMKYIYICIYYIAWRWRRFFFKEYTRVYFNPCACVLFPSKSKCGPSAEW